MRVPAWDASAPRDSAVLEAGFRRRGTGAREGRKEV